MLQFAGNDFRTEPEERCEAATLVRAFRPHPSRKLGRSQKLAAWLPVPITQADAELAKVSIRSAEMMPLRRIMVMGVGYHNVSGSARFAATFCAETPAGVPTCNP
jgi:hypothetical protein